jgi:hypothetical protein
LHMKAKEIIENAKIEVFMVLFWNRTIYFWNVFLLLCWYWKSMFLFIGTWSVLCVLDQFAIFFFLYKWSGKKRRNSSLCKSYQFALLIYFRC